MVGVRSGKRLWRPPHAAATSLSPVRGLLAGYSAHPWPAAKAPSHGLELLQAIPQLLSELVR